MSLTVSSMDYPSSALRAGLLEIKPVPTEEIVKIGKLRLVRKGVRYESQKQIENYEDYVNFRFQRILGEMPMPNLFSAEDVFEHFFNKSIKRYNEDTTLQEELNRKDISLLGFVDFIKNRFESEVFEYYGAEAYRFINSNLPLSFYTRTSMLIDTYSKFLYLIKRIVRRYQIQSNMAGVRYRDEHRKAELHKMKTALSPLIDKMDMLTNASLALKIYMCLWSAKHPEEIDFPEFIDKDRLNPSYFEEYKGTYYTELKGMRRMLFSSSKKYEPELFNRQIKPNAPTTVMLSKMLSLNQG